MNQMSAQSAPVKTPECRATQEALIHDDNSLRLTSDCPACHLFGVRCLIASHPSSAGMSYTSCSNLHLFPCSLIFLSPIHSSSLLAPNSAPQSHFHIGLPFGTLRSVRAVGAGNDSVSTFLADFACRFFHDLVR